MRTETPALIPIFRSQAQAELLTLIFLHPQREYTLSELSAQVGTPLATVQREVNRLSHARLITDRRVGRARVVSAAPPGRYTRPLTELLTVAFGPHIVVEEEFAELPADAVAIYGSWAARYHGIIGPPPADVDVLIIGELNRADIYDAADRAEQRIGFPVNVTRCSPARWAAASDALIQQIKSSPIVWLSEPPEECAK